MLGTQNRKTILALATVAMLAAIPALARGPHRGPGGGEHGRPIVRGVLDQLVFPCQAECTATAETCVHGATDDAVACTSAACSTEISAAQTACQADRTSDACDEAFSALAECASSCLDTRATALGACRSALRDCRDACAGTAQ
jgi:hypothetical protein